MDKILCPTDFSKVAKNAMSYAAEIGRRASADLTYVNVTPSLVAGVQSPGAMHFNLMDDIEESVRVKFIEICKKTEADYGINCDFKMTKGKIEENIPLVAGKGFYDVIVAGTDGVSNFFEFFYGSNSYRVLEEVDCPMLIVPEKARFREMKKIVYASNYMDGDIDTIKDLIAFTRYFIEAEIIVLHISEDETTIDDITFESFKEKVKNQLPDSSNVSFVKEVFSNVTEGLHVYMMQSEADLLSMLTRHRSYIEDLVHASVSKKLSGFANYPMLVFHE